MTSPRRQLFRRFLVVFSIISLCLYGPVQRVWAIDNIPNDCSSYASDATMLRACIIQYYTSNNIIFNDPDDGGEQCGGENSTTLTGNSNLEKVFNYLKGKGLNDVEAAAAIGNIDQESGGDPTIIQGGGHTDDPSTINAKGWGLIQWTPGKKVLGIATGMKVTGKISELSTQLDILWGHMTGTSPTGASNMAIGFKQYTSQDQLLAAVTYFHDKIEGSADATMANRLAKAKNALKKYAGGGTSSGSPTVTADPASLSTGGSNPCSGAVAGSAVQTAIKYAWPDYRKKSNAPYFTMTPAYAEAVKKAQDEGRYVGGSSGLGYHPGIDCGGFVTTVMHDSGADPDYNKGKSNTVGQEAYVKSSGKYTEITDPTTAKLKPGDIAINGSHTYIYVGEQQGFATPVASASIAEQNPVAWRAPMAGYEAPADPSFRWYHLNSSAEGSSVSI